MRACRRVTSVLAWLLLATVIAASALGMYLGSRTDGGYAGLAVFLGGFIVSLLLIVGILISTAIQSLLHVRSLPPARARRSPALWAWVLVLAAELAVLTLAWSALPAPARVVGLLLAAGTLAPSLAMALHAFRGGRDFS